MFFLCFFRHVDQPNFNSSSVHMPPSMESRSNAPYNLPPVYSGNKETWRLNNRGLHANDYYNTGNDRQGFSARHSYGEYSSAISEFYAFDV